jgi:hypothetical protein
MAAVVVNGWSFEGFKEDARRRNEFRSTSGQAISAPSISFSAIPRIESTVRYLSIEVDDAIEIAEKIDI